MTIEVEVLKRVKSLMIGRCKYICVALREVAEESPECKETADCLRNLIHYRLAYRPVKRLKWPTPENLTQWLSQECIPNAELTPERVHQHRLDWLDLLIKEFS